MLRNILRFSLLGLIFATPFIVNIVSGGMFFPFITGKNFSFRIIIEAATALWLLLMLVDKSVRPRFSWLLGGVGLFLGVIAAADIFGVDPHRSIWSSYERMEGLVALIHLGLYFVILASVLRLERLWGWLLGAWLMSSLLVFWGAVMQMLDPNASTRVDTSLGNPAYLGVYALANFFLAVYFFMKRYTENKRDFILYSVGAVGFLNLILVFKSQTRGSMLGLIGGLLLSAVLYAWFAKEKKHLRKYLVGGIAGFILLAGTFVAFRDAAWIAYFPSLKRLADISYTDTTTHSRLTVWKMSYRAFQERPILGWGQENFIHAFGQHYDPAMWKYEPWYDRSHNVFFDWLVAGGILGLLAYLSLYGAALYYIWVDKKGKFTLEEKAIVTGLIAAYFVHNIFVFDNLISYMFFSALLAWIHARVTHHESEEHAAKKHKKEDEAFSGGDIAMIAALVLAALSLAVYYFNVRDIKANKTMLAALRTQDGVYQDGEKQKLYLLDALELAQIGRREVREQITIMAAQTSRSQTATKAVKEAYVEAAEKQITAALTETPFDLRILSSAFMLYANLGVYEKADEYFTKATTISPQRATLYLDYYGVKLQRGDGPGALALAERALTLMPENDKAKVAVAASLVVTGKMAEAKGIMEPLLTSGALLDEKLMYALTAVKAHTEVAHIIESVENTSVLKARDYLYYQDALLKLGRKADAIVALKKAAALDPSIAEQVEDYIQKNLQ